GDISDSCKAQHAHHLSKVLQSPTQNRLYRSVPIAYMWDDHDYGPNNSSSSNKCRAEAQMAYQRNVPHYPLAVANRMPAMSQSFVMGRVRFVMPDLRSMKQLPYFDGCEKTKLGTNFGTEAHLQWFESELLAAKTEGQAVAWISTIPFIGTLGENGLWCGDRDAWPSFAEERARIATFIRVHEIPVFILSGDAHMLAMDDGSNSKYAEGAVGIPVFQAGALDRSGSHKGGPYSHGAMAAGGQFGWMEVEDEGGDSLLIRWIGKNLHGDTVTSRKGILLTHEFRLGIQAVPGEKESWLARAAEGQLRVWPNPTADYLNIELPDSFSDGGSLRLIDVRGRTIFDLELSASVFQLPLPPSLSRGLYWIQAQPAHGKVVYERVLVD
ncbi:MAG: alkaline phosphatase D family protein, partial [Bacteroidota bacterium]